jgi:ribosomal protein S18 acetylase RimI-like enzyme
MNIRLTTPEDWRLLKHVRLAALLDTPTAFGVSYRAAARYTDEQWKARASSTGTAFWLAFEGHTPVGMVGAGINAVNRYNLIGMWVEPAARGSGVAAQLMAAVKARAVAQGYEGVYLEVSPSNARAARFYLKQGFTFVDEWAPLESHPSIAVQTLHWAPS